jgi:hypothetical protein
MIACFLEICRKDLILRELVRWFDFLDLVAKIFLAVYTNTTYTTLTCQTIKAKLCFPASNENVFVLHYFPITFEISSMDVILPKF